MTNVLLAHSPETNLWKERRSRLESSVTLASLPVSLPPLAHRSSVLPASVSEHLPLEMKSGLLPVIAALPAAFGSIRSVSVPEKGKVKGTVIHIQDIHLNPEAQQNISQTVSGLMKHSKVNLVALEGAFGAMDFSSFQRFPRASVDAVADYLFAEKKISGAVFSAFGAGADLPAYVGIDDRRHYDANIDAYRRSAPLVKKSEADIEEAETALARAKGETFNKALSRFDARVESYRKGKISWGDHVRFVAAQSPAVSRDISLFLDALARESSLDFVKVEAQRAELLARLVSKMSAQQMSGLMELSAGYRAGQIQNGAFYGHLKELCVSNGIRLSAFPAMDAYIRYVLVADAINVDAVITATAELEDSAYRSLAHSRRERDLIQASKALHLTSKLVKFSLTSDEWTAYKKMSTSSKVSGLDTFESFYREAEARDHAMAENLIRSIQDKNAAVTVLVSGGFHSSGINAALKQNGIATIVFAPKITKVDDADGSRYLNVFTQEKTPLDQLFAGEKLFVSPPVMVEPAFAGQMMALFGQAVVNPDGRASATGKDQTLFMQVARDGATWVTRKVWTSDSKARSFKVGAALIAMTLLTGAEGGTPLWVSVSIIAFAIFAALLSGGVAKGAGAGNRYVWAWATAAALTVMSTLVIPGPTEEQPVTEERRVVDEHPLPAYVGLGFLTAMIIPTVLFRKDIRRAWNRTFVLLVLPFLMGAKGGAGFWAVVVLGTVLLVAVGVVLLRRPRLVPVIGERDKITGDPVEVQNAVFVMHGSLRNVLSLQTWIASGDLPAGVVADLKTIQRTDQILLTHAKGLSLRFLKQVITARLKAQQTLVSMTDLMARLEDYEDDRDISILRRHFAKVEPRLTAALAGAQRRESETRRTRRDLLALLVALPLFGSSAIAQSGAKPAAASQVSVVRNDEGTWMNVNGALWSGAPGFAYQPVPAGSNINQFENGGLAYLYKALLPAGGVGIDARKYPALVRLAKSPEGVPAQGHAEMLKKQAGAKFIRTYNLSSTTPEDLRALSEIFKWMYEVHGIMFVAGMYNPTDLQLVSTAAILKTNPGLLMYDGWNEIDQRGATAATYRNIDRLAGILKRADPRHPVAIVVSQTISAEGRAALRDAKNIDVVSVTVYDRDGAGTVKFLKGLSDFIPSKAVMIGEIGIDTTVAPAARARRFTDIAEALITTDKTNPSVVPLVTYFEFTPERWKGADSKWEFVDENNRPTPSLLAVNAVHQNWVAGEKRKELAPAGEPVALTNEYRGADYLGKYATINETSLKTILGNDTLRIEVKAQDLNGLHIDLKGRGDASQIGFFSLYVTRTGGVMKVLGKSKAVVREVKGDPRSTITIDIPVTEISQAMRAAGDTTISAVHVQSGKQQNKVPLNPANVSTQSTWQAMKHAKEAVKPNGLPKSAGMAILLMPFLMGANGGNPFAVLSVIAVGVLVVLLVGQILKVDDVRPTPLRSEASRDADTKPETAIYGSLTPLERDSVGSVLEAIRVRETGSKNLSRPSLDLANAVRLAPVAGSPKLAGAFAATLYDFVERLRGLSFGDVAEAVAHALKGHSAVVTLIYVTHLDDEARVEESLRVVRDHLRSQRGSAGVGIIVVGGDQGTEGRMNALLNQYLPDGMGAVIREDRLERLDEKIAYQTVFDALASRTGATSQRLFKDLAQDLTTEKRVVVVGHSKTPYEASKKLMEIMSLILPLVKKVLLLDLGAVLLAARQA